MESSSRESAREIARLRTKLFELEISLSLINVDPLPTKPTEEIEITPVPPQESSMTVDDLQPDILGNISPRNRVATLILPPKSIEIEKEIAPTIDDLLQTPKGGERTRADSGFDIDRIPTPDELRDNPMNVHGTTVKSPPKSLSTKKRREIIKEGMVERTFALYEDGDTNSLQNPTVMGEATIQFKYVHEKQQKKHVFTMTRIKVENYPMDELKTKFEIFVIVSVLNDRGKSIWTIETPSVRDPGSMVQWDHDPTQAVDDKKFSVSAADFFNYIDSENGMKVCCTLKKKLSMDGKDQLVGAGSASLLFSG